jgi:phosphoglucosamine mutase
MQLFGTSGIRRLADRDLVQLSLQVGMAVGTLYPKVVVGRDTRTSGNAIYHALTAGILASGAFCSDAGILPTPTLAFVTREFSAGVMITASHNPPQYNGLKLLNPDGSAFSPAQQKEIEDFITGRESINIRWDTMKTSELYDAAIEKHISRILEDISRRIKLKVVVDCGCGAAYYITPHMLTRLGCEVIPLNCLANGIFPHDVEPIESNLTDLMRKVRESQADLGIAHDGDADRVMVVDDLGRFVPGDKLLAIFSKTSGNLNIVTTIDASMCIEELGFNVERTRVGDPYVSEALKKGAGFGGEPSGAWVFPQISLCPDGIYGAARIAEITSRQRLSALVDSIPSYPVIRGNVIGNIANISALTEKLVQNLNPASINDIDGIKLIFKDGWLLIRASGTEPKIRVTSEAKDAFTARQNYENAALIISNYIRENS